MSFRQRLTPALGWLRRRLKNRYVRVGLLAGLWMLFFDRYDVSTLLNLQSKVADLKEDKAFYQREIERLKTERDLFESNLQEVERIARETYLMKRPDEDLYVLEYVDE